MILSRRLTTAATPEPTLGTHRRAQVNGVRLHFVEAGSGPLVVLLHGFPEFWFSWRHQIPALAALGFRVAALDMRGYNLSDKPRGIENYRIERLGADVAALIGHLGEPRAHVIGHDWGGVVAWWLAMHRPEVVDRLAVLNAPHPAAYLREVRRPGQLLRSWYILFFQMPRLPELLIRAGDFAALTGALRAGPPRPAFTEADLRLYKDAISKPGALTAAVNYYRAAFRHAGRAARTVRPVRSPTLVIWGERDRFLSRALTQGLKAWVPDVRVERIADAGHWVQNEAPAQVNGLLAEFLGRGSRSRPR